MTEIAIETKGLTRYYGAKKAVDSVDLKVPAGCVYGLLGRNGSGKSTLIRMIMGMLPPTRGSVHIKGRDPSALDSDWRASVAYMAEGHPLYKWMTVGRMVEFMRNFYKTWNQDLVDRIFGEFNISSSQKIRNLSRGQHAQVALAIAVAPEPDLLVFDDPTLGLDTVVRQDFLESLIRLIQSKGRTILFSSHILAEVEHVADRIGILMDGVLRVDCPVAQFRDSMRKVVVRTSALQSSGVRSMDSTFQTHLAGLPGLLALRRNKADVELVFAGYNHAHREKLSEIAPGNFEEIEMNLEEAFVEYTRDQKILMPSFA